MRFLSMMAMLCLSVVPSARGDDLTAAECRVLAAPVVLQTSHEARERDLRRERHLQAMVDRDVRELRRLRQGLSAVEKAYFQARAEGLDLREPSGLSNRLEHFMENAFELECRSPSDFAGLMAPSRASGFLRGYCNPRGPRPADFATQIPFGRRYRAAWREGTLLGIDRLETQPDGSRRHFSVRIDLATGEISSTELEFSRVGGFGRPYVWSVRARGPDREGTEGLVVTVPPLAAYVANELNRVCGSAEDDVQEQAASTAGSPRGATAEIAGGPGSTGASTAL